MDLSFLHLWITILASISFVLTEKVGIKVLMLDKKVKRQIYFDIIFLCEWKWNKLGYICIFCDLCQIIKILFLFSAPSTIL